MQQLALHSNKASPGVPLLLRAPSAGLGSMLGTFAGGLILGVAEACSAMVFGGPYREVVGLVIFLVVLVARPQGLFAK